jgi:hypothetical protein
MVAALAVVLYRCPDQKPPTVVGGDRARDPPELITAVG